MNRDLEIAGSVPCRPITEIASELNLTGTEYAPYGRNKAKLEFSLFDKYEKKPDGKLVLVTAISPTPAGEGKTTTAIGLTDALRKTGRSAIAALREPSLGPVFGIKGGAAGGGWSQVIPMEEINLHFTGDFHAVTSACNLIAAMTDNHIFHGNRLGIDPDRISIRRCLDMNERALRHITMTTMGKGGYTRAAGFDITAASELMAVLCLASGYSDLKQRIGRMIVGYTGDGEPITAEDIHAAGAAAALLKEALKPNLVQTLEGTPVLIHGGPFANIAHGCNSLLATKLALKLADYTITEAGFGADLGAEKFFDIKCRFGGLKPSASVLVVTIRSLKMHGGVLKNDLGKENIEAVKKGLPNLIRHLDNMLHVFKIPTIVAINRFPTDSAEEIDLVMDSCRSAGAKAVLSDVWAYGSRGGIALADAVVDLCTMNPPRTPDYVYPLQGTTLREKINAVVQRIYHGSRAVFTAEAEQQLERLSSLGMDSFPICIAKTQYSFTGDKTLYGAPDGFELTIRELRLSAGAGFVVALAGDIMTMPGLPAIPSAEQIDISGNGVLSGLF